MKNIKIFLFNKFKFFVDNVDITRELNHAPKKLLILQYLILNNCPVSVSSFEDLLWRNATPGAHEDAVKNLIKSLQEDLALYGIEDAILVKRNKYIWNSNLACKIDINSFEELYNQVKDATKLTKEIKIAFDEIMFLYEDDLLNDINSNSWVAPKAYHFHEMYLQAIDKYIDLLKKNDEYTEIMRVCKMAFEVDAFDTQLNLNLMRSLLKIGKHKEALMWYEKQNAHFKRTGIEPSQEMMDFYNELIAKEQDVETNIKEIYDDLKAEQNDMGGFVCEYAIFKDIYRLYMRNLKRLGTTIFLGVVSVRNMGLERIDPLEMDLVLRNLKDILQSNLRCGDTIARYNLSQFTLLLPNVETYEMGKKVLRRIQNNYYSNPENSKYRIDYHILELG